MLYLLSYDRHMSVTLYGIWSAVGKVNLFYLICEQSRVVGSHVRQCAFELGES